jgi:hypothetical protein
MKEPNLLAAQEREAKLTKLGVCAADTFSAHGE